MVNRVSLSPLHKVQSLPLMTNISSDCGDTRWVLPEKECCVPSLDSSDVPPMARIPSFLLMALRKLLAMSPLFKSWKIC